VQHSRFFSEATRIDKFCHAGLAENAACGVADTSNLHRAFVLNKTKWVMLAVILVLVVGTIRLVGSNANNAFSSVASTIQ